MKHCSCGVWMVPDILLLAHSSNRAFLQLSFRCSSYEHMMLVTLPSFQTLQTYTNVYHHAWNPLQKSIDYHFVRKTCCCHPRDSHFVTLSDAIR